MNAVSIFVLLSIVALCYAAGSEDWIEEAADPEEVQRILSEWKDQPLNLVTASAEQISWLPFFDLESARSLVRWRDASGELSTLSALQKCERINAEQRESLYEYCIVEARPVRAKFTGKVSGQTRKTTTAGHSDESRISARFADDNGTRAFMWANRAPGHSDYLDRVAGGVETRVGARTGVLFGDFQFDQGTGLISSGGWGASSWLSNRDELTPRLGHGLRLGAGRNRLHGFRGGAAEYQRSHLKFMLFGSEQRLDGARDEDGVIRITEGQSAGAELAKARANQLMSRSMGSGVAVTHSLLNLQLSALRRDYSALIETNGADEKLDEILQCSLAGAVKFERVRFTGEIALDDLGGKASNSALSIGSSALGAVGYYSTANEHFFGESGSAWGSFGGGVDAQQQMGVRFGFTSAAGQTIVHGSTKRGATFSDGVSLSDPEDRTELLQRKAVANDAELEALIGRMNRESIVQELPVNERIDRVRLSYENRHRVHFRIRVEMRSGQRDDHDGKLGSYLSVLLAPRVSSWMIHSQVTAFSFEDELVTTPIYERTAGDEFPLIALSGSGTREMISIARRFGEVQVSLKGAHSVRDLRGEPLHTTEFALGILWRQSFRSL